MFSDPLYHLVFNALLAMGNLPVRRMTEMGKTWVRVSYHAGPLCSHISLGSPQSDVSQSNVNSTELNAPKKKVFNKACASCSGTHFILTLRVYSIELSVR